MESDFDGEHMKKLIIIVAICLIVLAGGVLTGLYIIGDKLIDEAIDMGIPTIPALATVTTNEVEEDAELTQETQVAQISQAADSSAPTNTTDIDKKSTTKQPVIPVEKMNDIKDKVTAQDKVSAAAMVMSKLSSDEVNQLKDMLSGGLTADEKAKAKSIAFANFSSKEIEEIKEMYTKYMDK